ncbi:MAG: T9SS type A sorting domain-containing protein, partial [Bacteroidota bacterium]|nr:T9SS type A sorting domain-containing protein [Bacteroidota bacterium]
MKVVPVTTTLGALNKTFSQTFKANSVTVLQLGTSDASAVSNVKGAIEGVTFYPQITKDFIYLKGAGNEPVQVTILDLNGKTVLRKQVGEKGRLDLSPLTPALYIVKAIKGGQCYSAKVIKE